MGPDSGTTRNGDASEVSIAAKKIADAIIASESTEIGYETEAWLFGTLFVVLLAINIVYLARKIYVGRPPASVNTDQIGLSNLGYDRMDEDNV